MSNTIYIKQPNGTYKKVVYLEKERLGHLQLEADVLPIGATGPMGLQGQSGRDGLDGKDGINGLDGKDGFNGQDGKPGIHGLDGYTPIKGVDYFDGQDGKPGKDGIHGLDGYTPIKGVDYFDGLQGATGPEGQRGEKGEKGDKGDKGDVGPQGLQGERGLQGLIGPQGETGQVGATGATGPRGLPGERGKNGMPGPPGFMGTSGTSGVSGGGGTGTSGSSGTSGVNGDKYQTTSNSTLTIHPNGTASLITNDLNLSYTIGQTINVSYDVNNHFHAEIISYNPLDGLMVFEYKHKTGSGTYASWSVNLSGVVGQSGTNGTSGTSGAIGQSGTNGTSGTDGLTGTSGTSGAVGNSGANGTSGSSGNAGTSGTSATTASLIDILYPFQQNITITHTGTTSNTIIATYSLPAGTFTANDILRYRAHFTLSPTNGNTKDMRFYIGTQSSITGATLIGQRRATGSQGFAYARDFVFKNSLTNQETFNSVYGVADDENTDTGAGAAALMALTIDFNIDQILIVAIQLAVATDSVSLRFMRSQIYR